MAYVVGAILLAIAAFGFAALVTALVLTVVDAIRQR